MQFSFIITCYNTLALLKKMLQAVLDTSENDTEIILVNKVLIPLENCGRPGRISGAPKQINKD